MATVCAPCIEQSFQAWTKGGFADRLGDISCPTVVIGTDDPIFTPPILRDGIVDLIFGAEFIYIPGPGHYPAVEASATTGAKLSELLTT